MQSSANKINILCIGKHCIAVASQSTGQRAFIQHSNNLGDQCCHHKKRCIFYKCIIVLFTHSIYIPLNLFPGRNVLDLPVNGGSPFFSRNSFVLLKWPHPKKPLDADRGLGWGAVKTSCFGLSSIDCLVCAGLPHNRYTMGLSCSFSERITASGTLTSHPIPLWELA